MGSKTVPPTTVTLTCGWLSGHHGGDSWGCCLPGAWQGNTGWVCGMHSLAPAWYISAKCTHAPSFPYYGWSPRSVSAQDTPSKATCSGWCWGPGNESESARPQRGGPHDGESVSAGLSKHHRAAETAEMWLHSSGGCSRSLPCDLTWWSPHACLCPNALFPYGCQEPSPPK